MSAAQMRAQAIQFLLCLLLLAGCANLPFTISPTPAAATVTVPAAATSTPAPTASPQPTEPTALTVWLPAEFDPSSGTPASRLLAARLEEFSRQENIPVQVRVKASAGPGGMLDSLTTAFAAAPAAMPSLVLLSRPDLEVAALKGMIYPLDGTSSVIDEPDWYEYARQLAMVQGATFALPFAGDTLLVAYRPARVIGPPADWETIYRLGQPLAFPAGDSQALLVLSLYQSMGGPVEDAQRRPTLSTDALSSVLTALLDGQERGIFPSWLVDFETTAQVWQAYRDGRVNALVIWTSAYLSVLPPDTTAVALPAMDETPSTLATSWGWAVADSQAANRPAAARLAEFLTASDFQARWTEAAGYLPTRPSALAAWNDGSLRALLSPVAVSAQARPTVDQLATLGPALKEATLKILQSTADPAQAAQAAAERLASPEAR